MAIFGWIVSLAALAWLLAVAYFDIRTRKVPSPWWTGIPMLAALAFRLVSGTGLLIAAAAVVAVIVSERRHLQHKGLEALALVAGLVAVTLIFFVADVATQLAIVGVVIFWLSWELHYIGGADAMTLITCMLIWPQITFVLAYLAAGLIWSAGVRIKEGGWLKFHPVPGLAVVATAAILYLLYQVYITVKI